MKKILFGLIATVAISFAGNAQKKISIFADFNKVSSYAGNCVPAKGICADMPGTPIDPSQPTFFLSQVSGVVTASFNELYLNENKAALGKGVFVVSQTFSLSKDVTYALDLTSEYQVSQGNHPITKGSDGYYHFTL